MTSLRPDEQAKYSEIEKSRGRDEFVKKGVGLATNIATTATAFGLSSKILPFLSSHIPVDLALKGISKISPNIGKMLKNGMKAGLDIKDGFDYLRRNISENKPDEGTSKKEDPEANKQNILEQYSPELFNFIQGEVQKGRPILETIAMANTLDKFKPIIKKLTQDHKTPFANIVQSIFGVGGGGDIGTAIGSAFQSQQPQVNPREQARQQGLQKFNQKIKKPGLIQEETQRFNQGYGGQQPNLDDEILSEISNLFNM